MNLHVPRPRAAQCLGLCLLASACGTSEVDVIVRVDETMAAATTPPPPVGAPEPTEQEQPEPPDAGSPAVDRTPSVPDASIVPVPTNPQQPTGSPFPPPTPTTTPDAGALPFLDAGECQTVGGVVLGERYRFFLRSDDRCLDVGAPVTSFGVRTNYVRAGDEWCDQLGSLWQLVHSHSGSFEVRNAWLNFNMEIESAGDDVGDPAVLFPVHEFDHQRFLIRERGEGYAALSPLHAPEMCLSSGLTGPVSLAECEMGDETQEWFVEAEGCPPDPPPPGPVSGPAPAPSPSAASTP